MPRMLTSPVVLTATALILLTSCADELGPGPAGPATALTLPARTTPSSTTTAAPTADDDVAACSDGECEVRVRDGTTITVDPRFEVEGVLVTVADGRARIRIDTGTGYVSSGGTGGSSTYNDLTVRLLGVEGDTAIVRFRAG